MLRKDFITEERRLSLNCEFPLGEGSHLSEFLGGLEALFMGSQSFPHSASLLWAKIQRLVLFVLKLKQHLSIRTQVNSSPKNLTLYNFLKFSFCFWCITMYTRAMDLRTTRILLNLEAAPPVTLATLRLPSSVFKSSSCLVSSSFFLVRNSEHLTRGWKWV